MELTLHGGPSATAGPEPFTDRHATQAARPADLAVRGLRKSFAGAEPVLRDANLHVRRGESVALIGANGCGKSTLLRCCLGLLEPDAGFIDLLGSRLTALKGAALRRLRGRIGLVWQRHNLVGQLSALSNVVHGAQNRSGSPRLWLQSLAPTTVRDEAMQCLERVGLGHLAQRRAEHLSGGESQRVAIARALMQRPLLVLADEPVASLDPRIGVEVMEIFIGLLREQGITLLFVSHDLDHALTYANRVVGLKSGRIVLDAPATDLDRTGLRRLYG